MPRRARKGTTGELTQTKAPAPNDGALASRIQAVYKKILSTLQNQRDLRCDMAGTRTRAALLDSEYVVLHREYDKKIAAHDKLDALLKELTRQKKIIQDEAEQGISRERQLRDDVVKRFNAAMMDINLKYARQSSTREQREKYVLNLQNRVADLSERNHMRQLHFEQQFHRKTLEKQLAFAKRCQLDQHHTNLLAQLATTRQQLVDSKQEQSQHAQSLTRCRRDIREHETFLAESESQFDANKSLIDALHHEIKSLQHDISTNRNANNSSVVHIKAMSAECSRLKSGVNDFRDVERKERAKTETLKKLCKQVTAERAGLQNDIVAMQEAWTKLKFDIDSLKDQVGDNGKVFDMLQSIMNREALDVAVGNIVKNGKSVEDVLNDDLSQLRLTSSVKSSGRRTTVQNSSATSTTTSSTCSTQAPS